MSTSDRQPPHSLEAEQSVLGAVLIKPLVLDSLKVELQVDDFFLPAHREIFDAMLAVVHRGRELDAVTLVDELRVRDMLVRLDGQEGYLLQLANAVPTAENAAHYVSIVKEKAQLRRLIAVCLETASRAYGDCGAVPDLVDEHAAAIMRIATSAVADVVPVRDLVEPLMEEFERRHLKAQAGETIVTGIRTGVTKLDVLTAGFQPEEAITIAGDTASGKTALAMQTAIRLSAEPDGMAIVFNLEMSRSQLLERAFCHLGEVNSQALKTGAIDMADFKRLHRTAGQIRDLPLFLEENASSMREVEARCRRLRSKFPNKKRVLAVLDTLQLMPAENTKDNRARSVGMASKACKQLAKRLKMTFVMVSQINREGSKKKAKDGSVLPPTMHDLKESGDIEQDSDIIIINHNPEELDDADIDLLVVKHRNGRRAKMRVHWTGKYYRLSDPEIDAGPAADDRRFVDS